METILIELRRYTAPPGNRMVVNPKLYQIYGLTTTQEAATAQRGRDLLDTTCACGWCLGVSLVGSCSIVLASEPRNVS